MGIAPWRRNGRRLGPVSLDGAGGASGSERATGDPKVSSGGSIFFTTFKPSTVLCEQETCSRIDAGPPVLRVIKQMEPMLERLAAKGVDVSQERKELAALSKGRADLAHNPAQEDDAVETAYLKARMMKRQLFLRDPDLSPLECILFVARHPYEPSHNYSDILDAQWRPGGGICKLEIPRAGGRLEPSADKVTKLFEAGAGVARDPMSSFDASRIYFGYRPSPDGYFHVRAVNADGSGAPRLLVPSDTQEDPLAILRDGVEPARVGRVSSGQRLRNTS